jgi:thymidylate synthase (FAD)
MNVELLAYTQLADPLKQDLGFDVEEVLAGAVSECYQSKPSIAAVRNCIVRGHDSVLEHASWTFRITGVSRALLAQLTRHRIGVSPTVQSQRYVGQGGFDYVMPPSVGNNGGALRAFTDLMEHIDDIYGVLVDMGIPKEDARYVLPNACCTSMTLTLNLRSLVHLWKLRLDKHAQWEIRGLAHRMLDLVMPTVPNLEEYIRAVVSHDGNNS